MPDDASELRQAETLKNEEPILGISVYKLAVAESKPTDTGALYGVAVVIASSKLETTKKCIQSLRNQTVRLAIVVVDNVAKDDLRQYLRDEMSSDPRLHKITCDEPLNTSELWNCGLQWAWDSGFGEALVVDASLELKPDAYVELKEHIQTYDLFVAPRKDSKCFMISKKVWKALGPFKAL